MKYLKSRSDLILEKLFSTGKASEMILEKGTELFHGSGEDFDYEELTTGGYDGVLWTALDSGIAQTYIPVSSYSLTSTSEYTKLPYRIHGNPKEYTNLFGFTWTDIKYTNNQPSSYRPPIEFKEIDDAYFYLQEEDMANYRALKEFKAEIQEFLRKNKGDIDKDILEEMIVKEMKLEEELNKSSQKLRDNDRDKLRNEYVNKIIMEKGYKPMNKNDHKNDYRWKLKSKYLEGGKEILLDADYRSKGVLFVMKPKRDFKILDLRESEDSDLMNLEYNKIHKFRYAEEKGYDGIYINDFAQIESEGNVPHTSIGIFRNSIQDLEKDIIKDVVHPDENEIRRMWQERDWATKEYLEYKSKLK